MHALFLCSHICRIYHTSLTYKFSDIYMFSWILSIQQPKILRWISIILILILFCFYFAKCRLTCMAILMLIKACLICREKCTYCQKRKTRSGKFSCAKHTLTLQVDLFYKLPESMNLYVILVHFPGQNSMTTSHFSRLKGTVSDRHFQTSLFSKPPYFFCIFRENFTVIAYLYN